MSYCNKCGKKIAEGAELCHSCGKKFLVKEPITHEIFPVAKKYEKIATVKMENIAKPSSSKKLGNNYCPNCYKSFSEDKKFCASCGNKLEIQKEEHPIKDGKQSAHRISPWLVPWLAFGIILLLSGAILLPTKVMSYQVDVPYIDIEKYNADVPYEDVEEYVAQVPYETTENYVESVPVQEQKTEMVPVQETKQLTNIQEWVTCTTSGILSNGASTIKVTNTDSEGGMFIGSIGYNDNSNNFINTNQSKYIYAGSSTTFTYTPTPNSFKSCNFAFQTVPTKTVTTYQSQTKNVTTYKDVIKQRTVTKYRDETKYRKVTKTRTETREKEVRKTRTETNTKEVNWLFGFDAIINFRDMASKPSTLTGDTKIPQQFTATPVPSPTSGKSATGFASLQVKDWKVVSSNGMLTIVLNNKYGTQMTLTGINAARTGTTNGCEVSGLTTTMAENQELTVTTTDNTGYGSSCATGLHSGESYTLDLQIYFTANGVQHTDSGVITGTVE